MGLLRPWRKLIFARKVDSRVRVDRMSRALPSRPGFRNSVWKIRSSAKKLTGKCSVTWAEPRGQEEEVEKAVTIWIYLYPDHMKDTASVKFSHYRPCELAHCKC